MVVVPTFAAVVVTHKARRARYAAAQVLSTHSQVKLLHRLSCSPSVWRRVTFFTGKASPAQAHKCQSIRERCDPLGRQLHDRSGQGFRRWRRRRLLSHDEARQGRLMLSSEAKRDARSPT